MPNKQWGPFVYFYGVHLPGSSTYFLSASSYNVQLLHDICSAGWVACFPAYAVFGPICAFACTKESR